jgi:uncharacterized SAM-binding protein YcdF (DUF218 family)
MFFIVSKVFWLLVQPVSLVFILGMLGWILVANGRKRAGLAVSAVGLLFFGLASFTTAGVLLIMPLEDRFPRPKTMPDQISTIIMLGGATAGRVSTARGVVEFNEAGDRLAETLKLAQLYPQAKIVLSGGSGLLVADEETEAVTAQRFLTDLGVGPSRLLLERESRNTHENAALTLAMLGGGAEGNVVLVTSAFHMPRSVGIFRKAGLEVIAWPADYRSAGSETAGIDIVNPVLNLTTTGVAIREWIGLAIYALTGRSSSFLPGPLIQ